MYIICSCLPVILHLLLIFSFVSSFVNIVNCLVVNHLFISDVIGAFSKNERLMWKLTCQVVPDIAVYDTTSNCLTLTYIQTENNYYLYFIFLQSIITFTLCIIFRCKKSTTCQNTPYCLLITLNRSGLGSIWWICDMISHYLIPAEKTPTV